MFDKGEAFQRLLEMVNLDASEKNKTYCIMCSLSSELYTKWMQALENENMWKCRIFTI